MTKMTEADYEAASKRIKAMKHPDDGGPLGGSAAAAARWYDKHDPMESARVRAKIVARRQKKESANDR